MPSQPEVIASMMEHSMKWDAAQVAPMLIHPAKE